MSAANRPVHVDQVGPDLGQQCYYNIFWGHRMQPIELRLQVQIFGHCDLFIYLRKDIFSGQWTSFKLLNDNFFILEGPGGQSTPHRPAAPQQQQIRDLASKT